MTNQKPPVGPKERPVTDLLRQGRFYDIFRHGGGRPLAEPPAGSFVLPRHHLQNGVLRLAYVNRGNRFIIEQDGERLTRIQLKGITGEPGKPGARSVPSTEEAERFKADVRSARDTDPHLSEHVARFPHIFEK